MKKLVVKYFANVWERIFSIFIGFELGPSMILPMTLVLKMDIVLFGLSFV